MKHEPIFEWNKESGVASCTLTDGRYYYTGIARCHYDDADMMSEKTGCEIAFKRAKIHAMQGYRDNLKTRLSALNQLYYSMKHSTHFNEKSYENKMLQRQIRLINLDLETAKEIITAERQSLKEYIDNKDKFYKKTRANRKVRES